MLAKHKFLSKEMWETNGEEIRLSKKERQQQNKIDGHSGDSNDIEHRVEAE